MFLMSILQTAFIFSISSPNVFLLHSSAALTEAYSLYERQSQSNQNASPSYLDRQKRDVVASELADRAVLRILRSALNELANTENQMKSAELPEERAVKSSDIANQLIKRLFHEERSSNEASPTIQVQEVSRRGLLTVNAPPPNKRGLITLNAPPGKKDTTHNVALRTAAAALKRALISRREARGRMGMRKDLRYTYG